MNIDPFYCNAIVENKGLPHQCKNKKKIGEYCGLHHRLFINRQNDPTNCKIKQLKVIVIEKLEYKPEINLKKHSLNTKEIKEKIKEYNNKKW